MLTYDVTERLGPGHLRIHPPLTWDAILKLFDRWRLDPTYSILVQPHE